MVLRPLRREVERDLREVVGSDFSGWHVDERGHRDAFRVVREPFEVCVFESRDFQHRVDAAGVKVERPTVLVVGRAAKANGQHVFQSEQATHDDRPVGPRAGAGDDQPVAARLHRVAVAAVGRDTGGDVVGVAVEFATARDVSHATSMPALSAETEDMQGIPAIFLRKLSFGTGTDGSRRPSNSRGMAIRRL
jgi:hypothetical protein